MLLDQVGLALEVDPKALFLPASYRVEKPEPLDAAAIASLAAVRHHDVVERMLLRAAA